MSPFPSDLITDILCRLPVKTLLRFRCVSKPWGSLIDDSDFVKLHLHQSLKTNTNVKLFLDNCVENNSKAYAVDFDLLCNLVQFPRPFTAEANKYQSRIFGSCNGLLAVYHRQKGIALWNPSTRKCHYLPTLSDDINMDPDILLGCGYDKNTILGFGYDVSGNDYKVVNMLRSKTQNCFKVMVYSLKANSWKRIKDCPYDIFTNYNDGAYVNGSLHWVEDEIGEFF
ncbi:F-box domain - like 10 [Theobroma cacao]|nr:F-box domain - like 10 [Theobroma cacao]